MSAVPSVAPSGYLRDAESEATRLYQRHSRTVFGYCLQRLRRREDADDAVQTTFVYALMGLRRGLVLEFERAWLLKIAGNVCSSRHRASTRRRLLETPQDLNALQDVLRTPHRAGSIDTEALRSALAAMPDSQRRAILLREWQGLSYREIADELGLSKPATETLLFRARRTLARKLEDMHAAYSLNVASLGAWLRSLFTGGAAKTAAMTTAVVASAVAAPVVERQVADLVRSSPLPPPAQSVSRPTSHLTPSTSFARVQASQQRRGRIRQVRDPHVLPSPSAVMDSNTTRRATELVAPVASSDASTQSPSASVPTGVTPTPSLPPVPTPPTPLVALPSPPTAPSIQQPALPPVQTQTLPLPTP